MYKLKKNLCLYPRSTGGNHCVQMVVLKLIVQLMNNRTLN